MTEAEYMNLEDANRRFLRALKGGNSPSGIMGVWEWRGAPRTNDEKHRLAEQSVAARRVQEDDILRRVVSRDPCPYCGTRGDIGCNHRKRA